uniref:HMG box domain-containing protein n=1 Tax=Steinernema glaseri TaxID=37863 RepID=A0A1I7Y4N3_9BILA
MMENDASTSSGDTIDTAVKEYVKAQATCRLVNNRPKPKRKRVRKGKDSDSDSDSDDEVFKYKTDIKKTTSFILRKKVAPLSILPGFMDAEWKVDDLQPFLELERHEVVALEKRVACNAQKTIPIKMSTTVSLAVTAPKTILTTQQDSSSPVRPPENPTNKAVPNDDFIFKVPRLPRRKAKAKAKAPPVSQQPELQYSKWLSHLVDPEENPKEEPWGPERIAAVMTRFKADRTRPARPLRRAAAAGDRPSSPKPVEPAAPKEEPQAQHAMAAATAKEVPTMKESPKDKERPNTAETSKAVRATLVSSSTPSVTSRSAIPTPLKEPSSHIRARMKTVPTTMKTVPTTSSFNQSKPQRMVYKSLSTFLKGSMVSGTADAIRKAYQTHPKGGNNYLWSRTIYDEWMESQNQGREFRQSTATEEHGEKKQEGSEKPTVSPPIRTVRVMTPCTLLEAQILGEIDAFRRQKPDAPSASRMITRLGLRPLCAVTDSSSYGFPRTDVNSRPSSMPSLPHLQRASPRSSAAASTSFSEAGKKLILEPALLRRLQAKYLPNMASTSSAHDPPNVPANPAIVNPGVPIVRPADSPSSNVIEGEAQFLYGRPAFGR